MPNNEFTLLTEEEALTVAQVRDNPLALELYPGLKREMSRIEDDQRYLNALNNPKGWLYDEREKHRKTNYSDGNFNYRYKEFEASKKYRFSTGFLKDKGSELERLTQKFPEAMPRLAEDGETIMMLNREGEEPVWEFYDLPELTKTDFISDLASEPIPLAAAVVGGFAGAAVGTAAAGPGVGTALGGVAVAAGSEAQVGIVQDTIARKVMGFDANLGETAVRRGVEGAIGATIDLGMMGTGRIMRRGISPRFTDPKLEQSRVVVDALETVAEDFGVEINADAAQVTGGGLLYIDKIAQLSRDTPGDMTLGKNQRIREKLIEDLQKEIIGDESLRTSEVVGEDIARYLQKVSDDAGKAAGDGVDNATKEVSDGILRELGITSAHNVDEVGVGNALMTEVRSTFDRVDARVNAAYEGAKSKLQNPDAEIVDLAGVAAESEAIIGGLSRSSREVEGDFVGDRNIVKKSDFDTGDAADAFRDSPIVEELQRNGNIISKAEAKRRGLNIDGDYDGAPGSPDPAFSSNVYADPSKGAGAGGGVTPSEAAANLGFTDVNELWSSLNREYESAIKARKDASVVVDDQVNLANQRENFMERATDPNGGDATPMEFLVEGDTFEIDGAVVVVESSKDGVVEVVSDRFGKQTLKEGDEIFTKPVGSGPPSSVEIGIARPTDRVANTMKFLRSIPEWGVVENGRRGWTLDEARQMRTQINEERNFGHVDAGKGYDQKTLARIATKLDEAIETAGKDLEPEFHAELQKANQIYREERVPFDTPGVKAMLNAANGEPGIMGATLLATMTGKSNSNLDRFTELKSILSINGTPDTAISTMRDATLQIAARAAGLSKGYREAATIDATKFLGQLDKIQPSIADDLFPSGLGDIAGSLKISEALTGGRVDFDEAMKLASSKGVTVADAIKQAAESQKKVDDLYRNGIVKQFTIRPGSAAPASISDPREFAEKFITAAGDAKDIEMVKKVVQANDPNAWKDIEFYATHQLVHKHMRRLASETAGGAPNLVDPAKLAKTLSDKSYRSRLEATIGTDRVNGLDRLTEIVGRIKPTTATEDGANAFSKNARITGAVGKVGALVGWGLMPMTVGASVLIDNPLARSYSKKQLRRDPIKPATMALILGGRRALGLAYDTLTEEEFEEYKGMVKSMTKSALEESQSPNSFFGDVPVSGLDQAPAEDQFITLPDDF